MKKIRLFLVASVVAASGILVVPAPAAHACAPDPDGVNPCQSCYTYQALVYKVTHRDLILCPE